MRIDKCVSTKKEGLCPPYLSGVLLLKRTIFNGSRPPDMSVVVIPAFVFVCVLLLSM